MNAYFSCITIVHNHFQTFFCFKTPNNFSLNKFKYQYYEIFRYKLQCNFYWHYTLSNYLEKLRKKKLFLIAIY